jgi:hypothetical protein
VEDTNGRGRVKKGEYGCTHLYTFMNKKPVEVIFKRWRGKRENNRGDDPNQNTLYACMGMSQ